MVTDSLIKYLLSDKASLEDYTNRRPPTFEDVQRRLFLLQREAHIHVPDHYYRLNSKKSFHNIKTLNDIIRIGLYRLAEEHLELRDNRIYVKQPKQNDWQELITYIPPLVLQMAFLHIKAPLIGKKRNEIITYLDRYILPNTKYTALPHPFIPQMEFYMEERRGFHDLHMHLNGSTETDRAWQDFLANPDKIYGEIEKKSELPFVKELIEQESSLRSPLDFRNLLLYARNIRTFLFDAIFPSPKRVYADGEEVTGDIEWMDKIFSDEYGESVGSFFHPFTYVISCESFIPKYPIAIEGLMYVLLFNELSTSTKEELASMFHFYLLILGLANRLLVQQTDQYGFEQFQKITLNQLREESEKSSLLNRFFQIHGNDSRNIAFLGGRFSPKDSERENERLLTSIHQGWDALKKEIKDELRISDEECPKLRLVAHFIKREEDAASDRIRHNELRRQLWKKAEVLALQKMNHPEQMKDVVGIDAAASEFDTPPEVFAPSFRYLRRHGFKHFTYHAGEDFFHIISGLRAVYEAVCFNKFSCGDRIGHASAAGVSPKKWIQNVGEKILMHKGCYLDDLLFAYHLIISTLRKSNSFSEEMVFLKRKIPDIINRVQELSHSIYEKSYSLRILEESWRMRRYCPILLFAEKRDFAKILTVYDDDEWADIQNSILDYTSDERVEILRKYHDKKYRKKYEKIIEVNVNEIFTCEELTTLQKLTLEELHRREIVIETLPTSNVRIGHNANFTTYHLWNWLEWEKQGASIPPIVVGTDDPGIFATNIYNEYTNIYCYLVYTRKVSHNEAMSVIERLDKNARIYRFK